ANEGAADLLAGARDAGDDRLRFLDFELAGGEIVEEEKRLSALDDEIVDAHRDEILADRFVATGRDCDLQLGADAVGGREQDRVFEARSFQIEERGETA